MRKTGNYRHGLSKSAFNSKWYGIRQRCNNPNFIGYKYYGGRGIKCMWKSFDEFTRDMYKSYQKHKNLFGIKNTTIDRIDSNKNYCKENCRWATFSEQNFNKRNKTLITHNGDIKPISEWARTYNIKPMIVFNRINRGWTFKEAINIPNTHGKHSYKYTRQKRSQITTFL